MSDSGQQNDQKKDLAQPLDQSNQFDITESSYKTTHTAVRKARRFAMQGLYEWLMTDRRFEASGMGVLQENAPHDIAARTRANNAMHTVHLGYYHEMMRDIPVQIDELQSLISEHLDRDINLLDPIEHAILLIGTYELKNSLHVPYKVVLDEAMKLNTHFGATDAHKLINAVLDKLAPKLRKLEVDANVNVNVSDINQTVANTDTKAKANTKPEANTKTDSKTVADNNTNAADIPKESINTAKAQPSESTVTETKIVESESTTSEPAPSATAAKPRIGREASKKGAPVKRNAKLGVSTPPKQAPNAIKKPEND